MNNKFRKKLSMPGLLSEIKNYFEKIPSPVVKQKDSISLSDCLMSGLAIFSLKYPSLLQFDNDKRTPVVEHNLKSLYKIGIIPSDTYMRERLDELPTSELRGAYTTLIRQAQRGKVLEKFTYYNDYYLVSMDGTGYFSSHDIHCDQCCEKHHRNGKITYHHQMLGIALVHPNHHHVLPLAPEPIIKQDGVEKNDCERNAGKRLLTQLRKEYPKMKMIITEDGLASNGPHIKLLKSLNMSYILGAKPKDHTYLFDRIKNSSQTKFYQTQDDDGTIHKYRYVNQVPLNESHFDLNVNFLIYQEISPKGKVTNFSWVTDILLSEQTLEIVMKGGRARWRIENETFNTLKNQGYHFEHNFGHGKQHLSSVFAHLMLLAFLIDQLQGLCCNIFKQALKKAKRPLYFWERFRAIFFNFRIPNWMSYYQAIISPPKFDLPIIDTS
ncbi:transposase [Beggiatoa sp. PS]|nr:transposase [Beggiatoa sp. PS]